jgi:hypothetical protein
MWGVPKRSEQVLRFMHRSAQVGLQEVQSDRRRWPDGVRVKHWVNKNSLKCYDKGSILRVKATINEPRDFRSFRAAEKSPDGPKRWRELRRSVSDFHRRSEVSRAATERYLTALAAVHVQTRLAEQACRPVRRDGRRYRALNPLGESDAQLMIIVNRAEFPSTVFVIVICVPISTRRLRTNKSNAEKWRQWDVACGCCGRMG